MIKESLIDIRFNQDAKYPRVLIRRITKMTDKIKMKDKFKQNLRIFTGG